MSFKFTYSKQKVLEKFPQYCTSMNLLLLCMANLVITFQKKLPPHQSDSFPKQPLL